MKKGKGTVEGHLQSENSTKVNRSHQRRNESGSSTAAVTVWAFSSISLAPIPCVPVQLVLSTQNSPWRSPQLPHNPGVFQQLPEKIGEERGLETTAKLSLEDFWLNMSEPSTAQAVFHVGRLPGAPQQDTLFLPLELGSRQFRIEDLEEPEFSVATRWPQQS